jgi:MFS family permease
MAGSLICALATDMIILILGRIIHGFGGGGLTSLAMVVLGDIAAPRDRGRYYAYFAATYMTAGASGPALGGFPCSEAAKDLPGFSSLSVSLLCILALKDKPLHTDVAPEAG